MCPFQMPASAGMTIVWFALFDTFDGGGVGDFHLRAVIELDPTAHPNPLAGELAHIETRLTEKLHVLRRYRDGEILAIIGAEIDVGAALVQGCGLHDAFDDLECSGAIVELFGGPE